MWSYVTRVRRHVGRRGTFLVFVALVAASFAITLLDQSNWSSYVKLFPVLTQVPPLAWACGWLLTSVGSLVGAVVKSIEEWAYGVCALMFALWSMVYLQAWTAGTIARPWQGFAIYAAFAGVILVVAGWSEEKSGHR